MRTAAWTLPRLAQDERAEEANAIVAAGGIAPLVQLLRPVLMTARALLHASL
jgi:hypothetical protein